MVLYIGGAGQGKARLAARKYAVPPEKIADGAYAPDEAVEKAHIVDHVHLLVRRYLEQGKSIAALEDMLADKIIVCDEIGCGIIPADAFAQRWREETGRLCCRLAGKAHTVVRVHCGIGVCIKGAG